MVISTEKFKKICSTVLAATNSSELSTLTETLELKSENNTLYLNVTNKEYYASIKFELDHEENFRASVNANLFLKLVAAVTSENIELVVHDTYLNMKANGNYKIPLIFENDALMEIPEITINNPVATMPISGNILKSIVDYNSRQLSIGTVALPTWKLFYLDNEGCITYNSGACVNNFTLNGNVRVLLNSRLVNLFKLFKNSAVEFTLGYDTVSDTIIQTKVAFETPEIKLVAITGCDDTLLNQVPVNAIRDRANKNYPNSVVVSTAALSEAINRLLLFSAGYGTKENLKPYSRFDFCDNIVIYDSKEENTETLSYENGTKRTGDYSMSLDLSEVKKVIDGCTEDYLTINFGDGKACVITRGSIKNVIPETH